MNSEAPPANQTTSSGRRRVCHLFPLAFPACSVTSHLLIVITTFLIRPSPFSWLNTDSLYHRAPASCQPLPAFTSRSEAMRTTTDVPACLTSRLSLVYLANSSTSMLSLTSPNNSTYTNTFQQLRQERSQINMMYQLRWDVTI